MLASLSAVPHALRVLAVLTAYGTVYGVRRALLALRVKREAHARALAQLRGELLRRAATRLGAVFVKLGQVMSARPDLFAPELITELARLQDRLPAFPFAAARRILVEELQQPIESSFATLSPEPIAAASVAQVHRGTLADGSEVAVKVLRPGVERQVRRDGALLMLIARILEWSPTLRLSEPSRFVAEFVAGLERQTDLRHEAQNYARFRENFATDTRLSFPHVHSALSSRRVLVMDFVHGAKLSAMPKASHPAVAAALRGAMMQMALVDGFMHADMHPGNMLLRADGTLVLLDVGLATELSPAVREMFVDLVRCIVMGTPDELVDHFQRYHEYAPDADFAAMREDLGRFSAHFRAQDWRELDYAAVVDDIMALGRVHRVRPVPALALVLVGVLTVQGISKQLAPEVNDFAEMARYLGPLIAAGRKETAPTPRSAALGKNDVRV